MEDSLENGDLLLFYPELAVVLVAFISFYLIYRLKSRLGVVFKKGFHYVALGQLTIALALLTVTVGELLDLEENFWMELIFEALALASVILTLLGARSISSNLTTKLDNIDT